MSNKRRVIRAIKVTTYSFIGLLIVFKLDLRKFRHGDDYEIMPWSELVDISPALFVLSLVAGFLIYIVNPPAESDKTAVCVKCNKLYEYDSSQVACKECGTLLQDASNYDKNS